MKNCERCGMITNELTSIMDMEPNIPLIVCETCKKEIRKRNIEFSESGYLNWDDEIKAEQIKRIKQLEKK